MKKWLPACLLACALPAAAGEFPSLGSLAQDEFRRLSEDLGAAFAYKGVTPATPLGLVGFDVGLEVSATDMRHAGIFRLAGGRAPDYLAVPKLHVHKGLPYGIDIGAFVGGTSDVSAALYGLDARFALLADGVATPAVAFRVSGTQSSDIGGLEVKTLAGDVMVSKKLAFVTPYAGAGIVRIVSEAKGLGLAQEDFRQRRVFAGLNANFAVLNLAVEAEKLGDNTTLSAKAGWRF